MKPRTARTLFAALIIYSGVASSHADSIVLDGDFDSLAVGTAPNVGTPAGHWAFPSSYVSDGVGETNITEFSIAVAPGGTNGNSLHLLADASFLNSQHLPNIFTQSVNKGAGVFLIASFDIYVSSGRGGGAVYLGNGKDSSTNRGSQIGWGSAGELYYAGTNGSVNIIASYPQGVWQSVRMEVDVDHDRYNLYSGQRGFPFSVISSNLPYRSGTLPYFDRFTIARFINFPDADAYFDNVVVGLAPRIVQQPGTVYLPGSGCGVLSVTASGTAPLSYQWYRNSGSLPISGANGSNLTVCVSSPSDTNFGAYQIIVTNSYGSVTSSATVLLFLVGPCLPSPPGLVSWWPGDGTLDRIGTNRLVLTNGITIVPGKVDTAFSLAGSTTGVGPFAQVKLPAGLPLGNSPRTIELWVKAASGPPVGSYGDPLWDSGFVQYGSWGENGKLFALRMSRFFPRKLHFDGYNNNLVGTTTLQYDTWYHIAVTYDGSRLALYLNGQLDASANGVVLNTASGGFAPSGQAEPISPLVIGLERGSGGFWRGLLDEISIYNRALSTNEIAAIFAAGSVGKCKPTPPYISGVALTAGGVVMSGTSGIPSAAYYLLGSTNLALPLTNWYRLGTNAFDTSGGFQLTNPVNPAIPNQYFRLQVP